MTSKSQAEAEQKAFENIPSISINISNQKVKDGNLDHTGEDRSRDETPLSQQTPVTK